MKEVNFYGPKNEYVISGSDDGNIFIWHKNETKYEYTCLLSLCCPNVLLRIVNIMKGDKHVVNCIQVRLK